MNGTEAYYLATATVIPLLLVAYLFSMDALGTLRELAGFPDNKFKAYLVALGRIAPFAALFGALSGGTACLLALYSGKPTPTNALWSIIGLMCLLVAGFVHLLLVILRETYKSGLTANPNMVQNCDQCPHRCPNVGE
ncbi:hypothetical protein [Kitasatospora sp. MBT63]|uniref:hypothetical protein n=1 Tax=Kitasatospora sp. MBT63 TaxID=1444768 RepID=UPI0011EA6B77|nr:hypothetical protein [Kitasatospora sp. MBT63]